MYLELDNVASNVYQALDDVAGDIWQALLPGRAQGGRGGVVG